MRRPQAAIEEIHPGTDAAKRFASMRETFDDAMVTGWEEAAALKPLGLEAIHPDDFLLDQLDLSPPTILQVIREQAAHTRRPSLTPRDLATLLGRAGVPDFADQILRLMATPLDRS
ncbi:MAG: hypothetical protein ACRDNT_24905 [Streptosporangiaceae bacterium]